MQTNIVLTKDLTRYPRYRHVLVAGAVLAATTLGNTATIAVRKGDKVQALPDEWRAATAEDGPPVEVDTETGTDEGTDPADTNTPETETGTNTPETETGTNTPETDTDPADTDSADTDPADDDDDV